MDLHNELRKMILVVLWVIGAIAAASQVIKPDCQEKCGNVIIPYPFGTRDGCYLNRDFLISCNETSNPPTPIHGENIRVLNISIDRHEMQVDLFVAKHCYNSTGFDAAMSTDAYAYNFIFPFSNTRNKFVAIGCDTYARILGNGNKNNVTTGCLSVCDGEDSVPDDGSCSGIGCCQTSIPKEILNYNVSLSSYNYHAGILDFNPCSYSFLAEEDSFKFSKAYLKDFNKSRFPVVLDWAIVGVPVKTSPNCSEARENPSINYACKSTLSTCHDSNNGPGYRCNCSDGYQGNPYLPDGCKDIDECVDQELNNCQQLQYCINTMGGYKCHCPKGYSGSGTEEEGCVADQSDDQSLVIKITIGISASLMVLIMCSGCLYLGYKKRKLLELKDKYFRQNGGFMLQQELSKCEGHYETAKIYTAEELKKATNSYDESRIVGQGGYGTVYKGFLAPDDRVVAIKKSKLVDKSQIEQFINEVVVLSQINHRNVVKLLGCCLETEVPLLVYEFVSNGTLFEHIHDQSNGSVMSWDTRLRIAAESAGVLSYLHSAASIPIIHRDVKSTNILLDNNYIAKVSDFGASRLVPLDQTELSTMVQGTIGYLDPEYLQTSQLTEKSDVYSFGVVLVELLTGMKPLSFARREEERSLANYFLSSLKGDRLFEVIESGVLKDGSPDQVKEVAELAKRCLRVKGEERPTMKEVAMELEGLRVMGKHSWVNVEINSEETENLLGNGDSSDNFSHGVSANTSIVYDSMMNQVVLTVGDGR